MFHPYVATRRAIQFVLVVLFGGENFLVYCFHRSNFFGRENFVVMFDDFFKFSSKEPFAFAIGTNLNIHAIIFNLAENGAASWAFHVFFYTSLGFKNHAKKNWQYF